MKRKKPSELVANINAVDAEIKIAKLKGEVLSCRAKQRQAVARVIASEAQLDVILAIKGGHAKKSFCSAARSKPNGVAVIAPATDWHVEETIESSGVNGKNSFNLIEAERRIKRYYSKVVELIDWQNSLAPVVELWHPLLGDLMTGYIHEELMETNSLSPTEACVFLQDMICAGIDFWLKETKLPIFIPTCVGNHGRTTPKKRIKTSYKNSYEWLLYMTLAKRYENDERVTWDVGKGYHNTQTIVGRKVRFHHGDGLRYNGGVGGITIPVNKSIAQWDKVQAVDLDIFGHWHTFMSCYPKWVSCGSLMGYSEYSVEIKAEYQPPTQTFIVLDRWYGLTQVTPVFLVPPQRKRHLK